MADQETIPVAEILEFSESVMSVSLATLGKNGEPDISYAPYVTEGLASFYIFVSGLAKHTANLIRNPVASIMLIESEQSATQIFARCRLCIKCDVTLIEKEGGQAALWQAVLEKMEARHGGVVSMLKTLPDFSLFQLSSREMTFVKGFGKAYQAEMKPGSIVIPPLTHISSDVLKNR